jgi:hypothetical protein
VKLISWFPCIMYLLLLLICVTKNVQKMFVVARNVVEVPSGTRVGIGK